MKRTSEHTHTQQIPIKHFVDEINLRYIDHMQINETTFTTNWSQRKTNSFEEGKILKKVSNKQCENVNSCIQMEGDTMDPIHVWFFAHLNSICVSFTT